jgi:NAD(P)-dependent dehydrogenase (short-subunit alcohol dehydrogenase family)
MSAKNDLPKQFTTYPFIDPTRFAGKLDGKVVLVTGASAGLGRVAALAFAAAGASVACIARRQDLLDSVVREIRARYSTPALAIRADICEPTAPITIVEEVERELGPVDILLNVAGIVRFSNLADEEDFNKWWRVVEVNLKAPVALTHAVLPSMTKRKTGVLITISSSSGVLDHPFSSAYGTSKAAVIKFQQLIALEVAQHGILSFSIHPGTVTGTEIGSVDSAVNHTTLQNEPELTKLFQTFHDCVPQTPELMANVCVALCAEQRFKSMNGCYINCELPLDRVIEGLEEATIKEVGTNEMYKLRLGGMF